MARFPCLLLRMTFTSRLYLNRLQDAKQSGRSERAIVREGEQKSREESCGGASKKIPSQQWCVSELAVHCGDRGRRDRWSCLLGHLPWGRSYQPCPSLSWLTLLILLVPVRPRHSWFDGSAQASKYAKLFILTSPPSWPTIAPAQGGPRSVAGFCGVAPPKRSDNCSVRKSG